MNLDPVVDKPSLIDEVSARIVSGQSPASAQRLDLFARHYLHRIPEAELEARSIEDWCGLLRTAYGWIKTRGRGATEVRIYNPDLEEHGWSCSHSVLEVITDDGPFLVDSTTLAISEAGVSIHLIIHPIYRVVRDPGGYLMGLATPQTELAGGIAESVMHFEIDRITDPARLAELERRVRAHLGDVGRSVRDWSAMREQVARVRSELAAARTPYEDVEVAEARDFLAWLADNHFTFLGYREYAIVDDDGPQLVPRAETGLGILSAEAIVDSAEARAMERTDPRQIARSAPLIVTKTNARSTVHRAGYMDYVGVMRFDDAGRLAGEYRFLGLFTSSAYNRRPWDIPFVRRKVDAVMKRSGFAPAGHGGKALMHIMETLPRDELFQASAAEIYELVMGIFGLQERQRTRLFLRRDRFGRFFSCLVFIPRDRFSTETRERIQGILRRALNGDHVDFTVQISESVLARVHVLIHVKPGSMPDFDVGEIEGRLVEAVRSWHDRLRELLTHKHGEDRGLDWMRRFGQSFPAAYMEDVTPWVAAFDVEHLALLESERDLRMSLYRPRNREAGVFRFKLFRFGTTIPLSDVLPMLENMGLRIVSERPYRLELSDRSVRWIQDFDMQFVGGQDLELDRVRQPFQDAFRRIVRGEMESDGFNRLILGAGLDWRQVVVLRGCCKYLLQTGSPFSQSYMEQTLAAHPAVVRALVELFEALFDPLRDGEAASACDQRARGLLSDLGELAPANADPLLFERLEALKGAQRHGRDAQVAAAESLVRLQIEQVGSLDEDRILRGYLSLILAMLRTNAFQGRGAPYLSFKLDSGQVPELPRPRPWREIFVYSPRVEGIHLRGGRVARGGLRWSDRREDFRTEVLGLMKAQMVKNTVIVPVGAKGGFVVKRLPETDSRDDLMAEVVACYRFFINGLLDITDNLIEDAVRHPDGVVRRDGDDPYLVVAADKGTATFSDIANSVSEAHGFWMGDAFASGGSVGYDHKKMGITARGAWESVKRHFRELSVDCQSEPFTVVGIGDMSGDVFGNGMLLSRQIRLRAAFNHLHIFLDPDPDPEASYRERERLFAMDRSAWTDYDPALISAGGGVYSRRAKEIRLAPEIRAWLGVDDEVVTPQALIRALLTAPVDLLWNGGIGTYVKASTETHAEVGDRANDAVRVDARALRARVVGEGGNLGLTQRARIEFALAGGRINTDAIDNSAGVDCSDHEVNIKILLNQVLREKRLEPQARNRLLADMTDEVASLVLRNNYLQGQAISMMEALSVDRLGSKAHLIDVLEADGVLDRELECLPTREEISERRKRRQGLTRPELAVLLAYSKLTLYDALLDSDVPRDPYLSGELLRYFPAPLQDAYADAMASHRLRREIIATVVTNSLVNRMGATFVLRIHEDTGAGAGEIAKAYTAAREIFGARDWWAAVESHDNRVPVRSQLQVQLAVWSLLRHQTRWLLHHHRAPIDIAGLVDRYRAPVSELKATVDQWVRDETAMGIEARRQELESAGFEPALAAEAAALPALTPALDVVEVARLARAPVGRVGGVYSGLDARLRLRWLMSQVESLPVEGQWHAHARGGLRDELFRQHRQLTAKVLESTDPGMEPEDAVLSWNEACQVPLKHFEDMVRDMRDTGMMDYATVSVAVRALEHLVSMV